MSGVRGTDQQISWLQQHVFVVFITFRVFSRMAPLIEGWQAFKINWKSVFFVPVGFTLGQQRCERKT